MARDIVILNGSPTRGGDVDAMVKAFKDGAESAGAQVAEFVLQDMQIHNCIACFKGNCENAQPCASFQDDMNKIYPLVKERPVLVFATPVYYWTVSAQLAQAMDRLLALEEGSKNLLVGNDRYAALLTAAAGGIDQFDPIILWFRHYIERMKWRSCGLVTAQGNDAPSDMQEGTVLEEANALGERAAHGII